MTTHESHEKTPKLSFSEKLHSILESEDNNDAAIWSNGEYDIISHLYHLYFNFMLSFDYVGEIRVIDENEPVSKLGMTIITFNKTRSIKILFFE